MAIRLYGFVKICAKSESLPKIMVFSSPFKVLFKASSACVNL